MIEKYFGLAPLPDAESYFALFAPDAVVEDEGREYHGVDAIRRWRSEVPQVEYDVQGVTGTGVGRTAAVQISGTFPGSPVVLRFYFEEKHGKLAVLRIRV